MSLSINGLSRPQGIYSLFQKENGTRTSNSSQIPNAGTDIVASSNEDFARFQKEIEEYEQERSKFPKADGTAQPMNSIARVDGAIMKDNSGMIIGSWPPHPEGKVGGKPLMTALQMKMMDEIVKKHTTSKPVGKEEIDRFTEDLEAHGLLAEQLAKTAKYWQFPGGVIEDSQGRVVHQSSKLGVA